jgi:hypothetical protein
MAGWSPYTGQLGSDFGSPSLLMPFIAKDYPLALKN